MSGLLNEERLAELESWVAAIQEAFQAWSSLPRGEPGTLARQAYDDARLAFMTASDNAHSRSRQAVPALLSTIRAQSNELAELRRRLEEPDEATMARLMEAFSQTAYADQWEYLSEPDRQTFEKAVRAALFAAAGTGEKADA